MNHKGHEGHQGLSERVEDLCAVIVDCGLAVHKALGPGPLESAYEHCLAYELSTRGVPLRRQVPVPIRYGQTQLDVGYRLDIVVDDAVVIEVKAVEALARLHEAQVLTYLKLSRRRVGFLMNFNVELFKRGLKRLLL